MHVYLLSTWTAWVHGVPYQAPPHLSMLLGYKSWRTLANAQQSRECVRSHLCQKFLLSLWCSHLGRMSCFCRKHTLFHMAKVCKSQGFSQHRYKFSKTWAQSQTCENPAGNISCCAWPGCRQLCATR